jgi:hypothetical protein
MVTFTLPSELRALVRREAEVLYDAFFSVSSHCLKEHLAKEDCLGTPETGFFGIMHTWTQLLGYHPHIHYIVPGAGLGEDGGLVRVKREDFLLPWEPLRDDFVKSFKSILEKNDMLAACPPEVWEKDWRVNIQAFGNGENAVKYLGAYVRKTAIGNSRIKSINTDTNTVTFTYLDRADGGARKEETLPGVEFVSRYLQHVFPAKFHRLRYYGYLHSRKRASLLRLQTLTETRIEIEGIESAATEMENPPCPRCHKPMTQTDTFKPWRISSALIDAIWGVKPLPYPRPPLEIRRPGRAPPRSATEDAA